MKLHNLLNKYSNVDRKECLLLIESLLNLTYSNLILLEDISISKKQLKTLDDYVRRIEKGEPVQYIIGIWDFINIKLKVDKRGLIPRAETEGLALRTLELAQNFNKPKILDVGCGTGCIGLFIKYMLPKAQITLCDISSDAISLTKENAKNLSLDVNILCMDMKDIDDNYDIIVSNPPYITKKAMDLLNKSVLKYEPHNALFGGIDGLDYYRVLAAMHNNILDGGYLALEIGIGQSKQIYDLLTSNYVNINIYKDIANIDRVITAKKLTKQIGC